MSSCSSVGETISNNIDDICKTLNALDNVHQCHVDRVIRMWSKEHVLDNVCLGLLKSAVQTGDIRGEFSPVTADRCESRSLNKETEARSARVYIMSKPLSSLPLSPCSP